MAMGVWAAAALLAARSSASSVGPRRLEQAFADSPRALDQASGQRRRRGPWRLAVALVTCGGFLALRRRGRILRTTDQPRSARSSRADGALQESQGKWSRLVSVGDILWAGAVGTSVTLRLLCSVRLSAGATATAAPIAASCWVTTLCLLISGLCVAPFASLRAAPRRVGPWLAGGCTLPAFLLVAAASSLGLGLVQMVLRLATLTSALTLDVVGGSAGKDIWRRFTGTAFVFSGVAVGILASSSDLGGGSSGVGSAVAVFATFVAGAAYVLQARLLAAGKALLPTTDKAEVLPVEEVAATEALVCQFTNAAVQLPILVVFAGSGVTFLAPRATDLHIWLLTGLQGAFYLRSLQVLPRRLGYATTFTVSLWGQLLTAALVDAVRLGSAAASPGRLLGLGLVVLGAAVSATGGTGMPRAPRRP
mmetsp:Transcript_2421/g.8122  ORF Transcript_2421/g.8122 Transcript_2421/m.8122 type:complete len:422 (-) Transcript_2421:55-1320(-)